MARTPDRVPGPSIEEETRYESQIIDPTEEGAVRYVSGSFRLRDSLGVYNPRSSTGLSLEYAIITTEGGIIYDSSGGLILKEIP